MFKFSKDRTMCQVYSKLAIIAITTVIIAEFEQMNAGWA